MPFLIRCSAGKILLNLSTKNGCFRSNKIGLKPVSMTCETGSLFWRVGRWCKVPLVPDFPDRQTYRTSGGSRCAHISGHKTSKYCLGEGGGGWKGFFQPCYKTWVPQVKNSKKHLEKQLRLPNVQTFTMIVFCLFE